MRKKKESAATKTPFSCKVDFAPQQSREELMMSKLNVGLSNNVTLCSLENEAMTN